MRLIVVLLLPVFFILFSYSKIHAQNNKAFVVVIDAGHGGKDPGNRGNGFYEKNIALNIALKTGALLKKEAGIKVVYTRSSDIFIPLDKRADIANKAKADLFVSIHCDAHNSDAYGAGTFVLGLHRNQDNFRISQKENSVIFLEENYEKKYDGFDPNNPESVISLVLMQEDYLNHSIEIANMIQQSFVQNLKRKNRTVKQAGFLVLRNTFMPSVLVETGFLTNKREGTYLNSKKGQDELSRAIAKAVIRYRASHEIEVRAGNSINNQADEQPEVSTKAMHHAPTFKIQIAASTKKLETEPYNFKGLRPISRRKVGALYRYYYGTFTSYKQAQSALKHALKNGYKGAYVKAFDGNNEVSITPEMKSK